MELSSFTHTLRDMVLNVNMLGVLLACPTHRQCSLETNFCLVELNPRLFGLTVLNALRCTSATPPLYAEA